MIGSRFIGMMRVGVAALFVFVTLAGCGTDPHDSTSGEEAACPLSPAEVSSITGTVVGNPSIYDYADHGLREMFGDTLRGCTYPTTTDDTTDITVEVLSIDADAETSDRNEFQQAYPDALEAHGRVWHVDAGQTAYDLGDSDEAMSRLESYESDLLRKIASGTGSPVTDGY